MEKPLSMVIHDVGSLERHLDEYFRQNNLTFEGWLERFGAEPYLSRNRAILRLLTSLRPRKIFEFACAGGFLARLLLENLPSIERYTCSNFSARIIEQCERQLDAYESCDVVLFDANKIASGDTGDIKIETYDTFLTTSFEHIQHDRELIKRLPSNRHFVFCVAGFDDPEHFRIFSNPAEIRQRYKHLLSIERIEILGDTFKKFVTLSRTYDGLT